MQDKGAGKNSENKEDKEIKLESRQLASQGQIIKEGRTHLLDREVSILVISLYL